MCLVIPARPCSWTSTSSRPGKGWMLYVREGVGWGHAVHLKGVATCPTPVGARGT